jgi:hypothetical protein
MTRKLIAVLALILFCVFDSRLCTANAQGTALTKKVLHGHVPAAVAGLKPLHRFAATNQMSLSIGLPLHNSVGLKNFLQQVYDPTSLQYRQYLTSDKFTEQYGPTKQDVDALSVFARANGFKVTHTHPNRMLLNVSGSVDQVEKAFGIKMQVYQHPTEPREFFAPDTEPSVNANLPILDISGLNNYELPRRARKPRKSASATATTTAATGTGSGTNGAFMAADIRAAYAPGVTLQGAGQTVAIVSFGTGYYPSDILAYEQSNNLSPVLVTNVLIDNASGQAASSVSAGQNQEVSLDIEMVIAMAPNVSQILVYESPALASFYSSSYIFPNDLLNRIATDNSAKQINCSWNWGNGLRGLTGQDQTTDQIFQQMAAQGQTFFEASGDWGAFWGDGTTFAMNNNDAPLMTSPYITIVGGTQLSTTGPNGGWTSEATWNDKPAAAYSSSGAISSTYTIPSWQQGIDFSANGGSISMRNIPDVSMLAHNVFTMSGNGAVVLLDGTSVASPLWAGFMALINQQAAAHGQPPVGFANPAIYAIGRSTNYAACFHDITTGNNTNSYSPTNFFAVPGYDLCTGWGTPTGQPLIDALAIPDALAITPGLGFTAANGPVGPFNITNQNFILTNCGAGSLQWTAGTTSTWLNISATSGTLTPAGMSSTVTIFLNTNVSNLPTGTNVADVWFTNLNSGFVQKREFTLYVREPLVQNGGFETGDFTGWLGLGTLLDATGVSSIVRTSVGPAIFAGHGQYEANLGGGYLIGLRPDLYQCVFLAQPILTVPGQTYLISFWLDQRFIVTSPINGPDFCVTWDGNTIFDVRNTNAGTLMNITCTATANTNNTFLEFGSRGDYVLDDVSVTLLPQTPPMIITQATNAEVPIGYPAAFGVYSSGTEPITYHWLFNGVPLADNSHYSGSASNSLLITNTSYGDLGNYSVVITNLYGAITSSVVSLQLLGSNLLTNGSFESPTVAQNTVGVLAPSGWLLINNTWIINGSPYPGYGSGDSRLPSGPPTGIYMNEGPAPQDGSQCIDLQGGSVSQNFQITQQGEYEISWYDNTPFPTYPIEASVYSTTILDGSSQIVISTNFNAFNLNTVQGPIWQRRSIITPLSAGTNTLTFQQQSFITSSGNGSVSLDTLLDNVAVRAVLVAPSGVAPNIDSQPLSQTAIAGGSANFSVTADGTAPLNYQWLINTTNLADTSRITGSSSNSLSISPVLPGDRGNYAVLVTNSSGSVTSSVVSLTVVLPPLSVQSISGNGTVTFGMSALPGYSYQLQYETNLSQTNWINLGAAIAATNTTLSASNSIGPDLQRFYRMMISP